MIEAKSLRIGNLICYGTTDMVVSCKLKHISIISEGGKYADGYSPIPLTEEWIVNEFGFYKSSGSNPHYTLGNTLIVWRTDFESECITNRFQFEFGITKSFGAKREVNLDYVHQLQNLAYVLTGEELAPNSKQDGRRRSS